MKRLDEAMEKAGAAAYVIYASSRDPDMRYLTQFVTSDPLFYIKKRGKDGILIVPQMEISRAQDEASCDALTRGDAGFFTYLEEEVSPRRAAARMVYEYVEGDIIVPGSFPLGVAEDIRSFCGVTVDADTVEAMRAVKSPRERDAIRATQEKTNEVMALAEEIIRTSTEREGELWYAGAPLTSDALRREMHCWLLRHGCTAHHTIISCGKETSQPHNIGSGTLLIDEPIVIDVFPQDERTGYFADMTRTFVKGEPSAEIQEIYDTVRDGQTLAEEMLRPGITGAEVHNAVLDLFNERGYATGDEGFIHSLGHGVGLQIHEGPSLSPRADTPLVAGNVVTVEPGLYYRKTGGVRLEDIGAITKDGFVCYTKYERRLIV
ncbi:M24 family metallopeptidase [Methanogenium organophilum]|uniref:Xaa-Pro peptidase family protein n=1 Tax=Methanogenium organophilum TaxID=2199 RepID=A0A9X9T7A8_METOG|nr:Xaa-Pro peptidase family protein [Methanogenium organophilum]WAI00236.1 Xaa-Pro peptidase family protein [Methanogenium organophilum]